MMIVREPLNWKVICIDDHGNERVVELIMQVGASKLTKRARHNDIIVDIL